MKIIDTRDGHIEPRDVYQDLIEYELMAAFLHGPWRKAKYKVGTGLDRLPPAERESIKHLKSSETFELRMPECLP